MKICPKCGKVLSYNSYFGAYICSSCNWEEVSRTHSYQSRKTSFNSTQHKREYKLKRAVKV